MKIDEITLMPGDFYVGHDAVRIKTLLGSCVAVVLSEPKQKIGAMCHFLLPTRGTMRDNGEIGNYADEVIPFLLSSFKRKMQANDKIDAKVYGAANMFPSHKHSCADRDAVGGQLCDGCNLVSCRNRVAAISLLKYFGLAISHSSLGGTHCRVVKFNVATGETMMQESWECSLDIKFNGRNNEKD